jgi:hypothetical protein
MFMVEKDHNIPVFIGGTEENHSVTRLILILEPPKYETRSIIHSAVTFCDEILGLNNILKWLKFGYFIKAVYKC